MAEENTNVQGTEATAAEPEKTFTQAEVDTLIANRLTRERRRYPSEEELTAFRTWQDSRQTQEDRLNTVTGERDTARVQLAAAQTELEQLKREKFLTGKGIPAEDLDYYAFKIGKLVTDGTTFEQAAEDYLKENAPNKVRIDMTAALDRGRPNNNANDAMNALIRGVRS